MRRSFCKVCFDSGKPVSMHTSHNVRDDRGRVCCPTLKSIVCAYCGCKGHGPKYCVKLEKDKKEELRANTLKADKPSKSKTSVAQTPVKHSKFASLEMSSDEEPDEELDEEPIKKEVAVTKLVVTSKPAPWATSEPRVTKWTDLYDSADEDDD